MPFNPQKKIFPSEDDLADMDVTVTTRPQQSEPMQMPGCLTFEENLDQLFLRWNKPAPEATSLHRVRFRKQLRALPKICKSRHQRIKGGKDVAYNFFTYFTKFVYINTISCLFIFWPTTISALTSHFPSLCFFFFRSMCLLMLRVNSAKRCRIRFRKLLTVRNVLPFPARSRRFWVLLYIRCWILDISLARARVNARWRMNV